ncbi:alpha/beta hydrolase family protein [Kitasatospora sp. LaBMicrA B282]|uniref:alpha/beta hydrolase family protein n=1 Tax=Kitasatospora sp. LaBMicrA B282 TaxID=3420949 RepID=UPI003D1500B8
MRTEARRRARRPRPALPTAAVLTAALAVGATAAPTFAADRTAHRGEIVSVTQVQQLSPQAAAAQIAERGYTGTAPEYGVDHYRVVYRTVDPQGRPTTASGLVSLPETDRRALHVVVFDHGTMAIRTETASVDESQRGDTSIFAAAGYATVAPDYLGLGLGPGPHPYDDLASETTATVDLLHAARQVARDHGHRLDRGVQVTGFSQGGPAAMALGKALQEGGVPHFDLAGLAPYSGPYDGQHAELPAALDGTLRGVDANYFLAYWLVAMNRTYHLYDDPAELFQQPYAQRIESLYDGTHSDAEIFGELPATPQQLLTPHAIVWAQHPTGALLAALTDNDDSCSSWTPRVPVHLFAADGDKDVAYLDSVHCAQQLTADGARVTLTDLGPIEHSPSRVAAMPKVLALFRQNLPA